MLGDSSEVFNSVTWNLGGAWKIVYLFIQNISLGQKTYPLTSMYGILLWKSLHFERNLFHYEGISLCELTHISRREAQAIVFYYQTRNGIKRDRDLNNEDVKVLRFARSYKLL